MTTKQKWRKILYENQGYPDNFTDKTFLQDLRKNINYQEVSFTDAVLGASKIVQELCTVIIFVLIFFYFYNEWMNPNVVLMFSSIMSITMYILYISKCSFWHIMQDVRTVFIFYGFGRFFSPVLYTLTDTISTNTIYTTTFIMMSIHLIFFDYGVPSAVVSNSLSLSAALFGSICLASRLSSANHALILIIIAIKIFLLFPLLRKKFGSCVILSLVLVLPTLCVLISLSKLITIVFLLALALIMVVFPMVFIKCQKFKNNIYGPWDEAVVNSADNICDLINF